jgi:hypothetical protein
MTNIRNDFALALDPIRFARSVGIEPDPWQRQLLLSAEKHIILNCSRQSGKSTIVALLSLHHALYAPDALVLVLSPSLRQSSELFKKIVGFYKSLGKPTPADVETALTLQLANGSRILSLPGKEQTIRGFSGPSLLIVDEAARVDNTLYYSAVRPMLAVSQGRIILLSTPNSKRGFFFSAWDDFENHGNTGNWYGVKITADQCPRITNEFLEQERRDLGERWFAQEYLCSFEESEVALFRYDVIQEALCDDIEELDIDLDSNADGRGWDNDPNSDALKINLD